ncbi:MAG: sulfite exporter TauE/SafE family protein [Candidatus Kapabacteria bacterium]|nr:sulfite exporter TauE/SafE family protein [Candidatus Kapabacteria bacterium]
MSELTMRLRPLRFYLPFAVCVITGIVAYVASNGIIDKVTAWWPAALTMVFGSFIAGASAEGGGAIAFPVFTLILKIAPIDARSFSFAIQSVGMVSASLLILGRGISIETRAVLWPALGGIVGLLFGTFWIAPFIEPVHTKLFFVSLWMAFGIGLYRANRNRARIVRSGLGTILQRNDILILLSAGLVGGMVTAIFGNGVDLITFCVLTLWYGLDEKVATPTSVVLMSILTVCGFALHAFVVQDVSEQMYHAWMAAAPVVLIFAPLGAFVISKWNRLAIANLLITIIVVQLLGALYVLELTAEHVIFSLAVVALGSVIIRLLDRTRMHDRQ